MKQLQKKIKKIIFEELQSLLAESPPEGQLDLGDEPTDDSDSTEEDLKAICEEYASSCDACMFPELLERALEYDPSEMAPKDVEGVDLQEGAGVARSFPGDPDKAWRAYQDGHFPLGHPEIFRCFPSGVETLRRWKEFQTEYVAALVHWREALPQCQGKRDDTWDIIVNPCMEDPTSYMPDGMTSEEWEKNLMQCVENEMENQGGLAQSDKDPDSMEWDPDGSTWLTGQSTMAEWCLSDMCEQVMADEIESVELEFLECMEDQGAYNPDKGLSGRARTTWVRYLKQLFYATEDYKRSSDFRTECTEDFLEACREEEEEDIEVEPSKPLKKQPKPEPPPPPPPPPKKRYDPNQHVRYEWVTESEWARGKEKAHPGVVYMMMVNTKSGPWYEIPWFMEKNMNRKEKSIVRQRKTYKGNDWGNYPYRGRRTGYARMSHTKPRFDPVTGRKIQVPMMHIDGYYIHMAPKSLLRSFANRWFPNENSGPKREEETKEEYALRREEGERKSYIEFHDTFLVREEKSIEIYIRQKYELKGMEHDNDHMRGNMNDSIRRQLRYWDAVKHEEGPDISIDDY